ncbi:uncharacterized protein LOC129221146 [Uloborus diversus]|uniref:uncharacterized protein LOC129221146 n=1 Tax=Uloborus diversus TaxID=327109 RepID=UPI002409601C|nr:uncharacterized protein LOC129221146 [Uloborus diversus]
MGYQHWPADFPDEYKTPLLVKERRKKSIRERIPARYVLTLLTFLGLGIQYTQRVNLNVTMVAMVNSTFIEGKENDTTTDECPNLFADSVENVTQSFKEVNFLVFDVPQEGL